MRRLMIRLHLNLHLNLDGTDTAGEVHLEIRVYCQKNKVKILCIVVYHHVVSNKFTSRALLRNDTTSVRNIARFLGQHDHRLQKKHTHTQTKESAQQWSSGFPHQTETEMEIECE